MIPLYIFDLDGTLALTEHRQRVLDNKEDHPQRWQRFFAACVDDRPNIPVIKTMERLSFMAGEVWIWSGRTADVRTQTVAWLAKHTAWTTFAIESALKMRDAADYTPDEVLKKQWLDEMSGADRARLCAVFDDRDKVVKMWRENGVPCFQVAEGSF